MDGLKQTDMKVYKFLEVTTLADAEKFTNGWATQNYALESIHVWETVTGQKKDHVSKHYFIVLSKRV